jgi:protease II
LKDKFFVVTNADNAINYKVVQATETTLSTRENWETVIPSSPSVKVEDIDTFQVELGILFHIPGFYCSL